MGRNIHVWGIAVVMMMSGVASARADKLADFKAAVAAKGCESIPYSSLQSSCKSQQSYVHEWCDGGRGPVKCDSGGSARLKAELDKEKRSQEELVRKKRDLESKRSRASDDKEKDKLKAEIEAVEKQIYDSKKAIDRVEDQLDKREDLVDKTIYNIGKCIDYRRAVMNVFGDALDKVRSESDPAIKPLASQLRDRFQASKRGHEIAIKDKENALSTCKREEL